jgi:phage-related protein
MQVLEICSGRIRIGALISVRNGRAHCQLLDALESLESVHRAHKFRLLALMELAAQQGLEALSVDQCHLIDGEHKVYEFRAGRLRLPFFKLASGRVLIATHVFLKTSQKTPRSEVDKVIRQKSKLMGHEHTMEWKGELP